jgi:uncharacterized repeat protein (TIGR03809 family)
MAVGRKAAIPRRGLTVYRQGNPVFLRVSVDEGRLVEHSLDNAKVFHRISLSRPTDSFPLRPRPFSLPTGWLMTHRVDVARGRDIVARWCALAEQRLDYLTELFETGRWRRFHSELAFLENIQEAKAAVEIWRDLLTYEASRDNCAVDIAWGGRTRTAPRRGETVRDQAPRFPSWPARIPGESPLSEVSIAPVHVFSDQAPSASDSDAPTLDSRLDPALDNAPELTLDLAVMHERYPLLRNAL